MNNMHHTAVISAAANLHNRSFSKRRTCMNQFMYIINSLNKRIGREDFILLAFVSYFSMPSESKQSIKKAYSISNIMARNKPHNPFIVQLPIPAKLKMQEET